MNIEHSSGESSEYPENNKLIATMRKFLFEGETREIDIREELANPESLVKLTNLYFFIQDEVRNASDAIHCQDGAIQFYIDLQGEPYSFNMTLCDYAYIKNGAEVGIDSPEGEVLPIEAEIVIDMRQRFSPDEENMHRVAMSFAIYGDMPVAAALGATLQSPVEFLFNRWITGEEAAELQETLAQCIRAKKGEM